MHFVLYFIECISLKDRKNTRQKNIEQTEMRKLEFISDSIHQGKVQETFV